MNNIFLIFSLFFLWSASSANATPPTLSQKYLLIKPQIKYLTTKANFDSEGGLFEDLPAGYSYDRINFGGSVFYTFSTDFAFDLGLDFAYAKSSNNVDDRTNLQLSEFHGKLLYQLANSPFEIIPELYFVLPFNKVDATTDDVLTGEGATQLAIGSWVVKEFGNIYFYLFAAYNYRDEGRSHLLPWAVGAELDLNGLFFGAEALGYESISDDENVNQTKIRNNVTSRVNAGSLNIYSVNPQQLSVNAWAGFEFTPLISTKLAYRHAINGSNSSVDQEVMLSMDYKIDMSKNKPKSRRFKKRKKRKRIRQFEVQGDDYDEELFDREAQRRRRKQKSKDRDLLNEAEQELENR